MNSETFFTKSTSHKAQSVQTEPEQTGFALADNAPDVFTSGDFAQAILQEAKQCKSHIQTARRHIHENPGTGFELQDTLSYVKQELEAMGYTPQLCGKAGLTALAGGKKPGKVFLLRADMDALPVREEAELEFTSQNGNMHACGHDMHTAMLLGAARLLKTHEEEIEGTVKLMFQPAEELLEGARDMIEAGVLKNPGVDAAMMLHVMVGVPFETGTVIVSAPGVSAPAADYFTIRIQGKGCHGAMPSAGIDPVPAAAQMILGLQNIQTRELPIGERAVLTIGTISGGTAPNVIPDTITMEGSMRAFDEDTREFMKNRIETIAEGTAALYRAQGKVTFTSGCPTLLNDAQLSEGTLKYAEELLGTEKALSVAQLSKSTHSSGKSTHSSSKSTHSGSKSTHSGGSEDFAYVSHQVPSIMVAVAAGQPETGYSYPLHHPKARFDEEALCAGSALYAYTAMAWLKDNPLA